MSAENQIKPATEENIRSLTEEEVDQLFADVAAKLRRDHAERKRSHRRNGLLPHLSPETRHMVITSRS